MKPAVPFEILVATMFRTDLDFLEAMFPHVSYKDHDILVINQTDAERQLLSSSERLRVINTEERGLSQSRNLAIQHANGEVCLVADDDVRYVKDVETIVLDTYKEHPTADVITFQMTDFDGKLYQQYPPEGWHTQRTVASVNGVVISFKPERLNEHKVYYDPHFGLGCTFQTANEYVFMKHVLQAALKALFVEKVILSHPNFSSGKAMGSDRVVYARAALTHKYYGYLSYLWVFKYLRFLIAHRYINWSELISKMKVGFSGIKKYKTLTKHT